MTIRPQATRVPWLLLALPALALARLLPEDGAGLWCRLAAATLVVLVPGNLVARALGRRSGSATLVWTLAALAPALALTFAAGDSLTLTILLCGAIGLLALPFSLRRGRGTNLVPRLVAIAAGMVLGIALWHVAGVLWGDALFHLGRVRKLDDFSQLSLHAVDEFRDGGLHPGYAFPLWHGFLALVARLGGVDPALVLLHEPSVLAPLALLVAFESGLAVFRSAWLGGAVAAAQCGLIALAPGHGGAYTSLALPATSSRQLVVPALLALFFTWMHTPSAGLLLSLAAAAAALAFVHPTYALFVLVPLGGFVVARFLIAFRELGRGAAALAAIAAPAALVLLWLKPIVDETLSHNPTPQQLRIDLANYAQQLEVFSLSRYRLTPEGISRTGAIAVAALVLVPLAAAASRRRWAALVLGGSLAVLSLELVSWIFPHVASVVSLSQARRIAGFFPFPFAFAGGAAVLARFLRWGAVPLGLGAGIWLQQAYPGDFAPRLEEGGPALATWIAAFGGAAALVVAILVIRRRGRWDARGAAAGLAALAFLIPVAVHGFSHWTSAHPEDRHALTPGLVRALRERVPKRAVVFSDLATSYEVAAYAPVYVAAAPPAHVANTKANRPNARRDDVNRFFETGNLAIPRRYGATWLVIDRRATKLRPRLRAVYADRRYALFRL